MLLGKRPRPPMKRTTSMKEIDLDLSSSSVEMPLHSNNMKDLRNHQNPSSETPLKRHPKVSDPRFISTAVSPRNHTRNSAVFMETASFLRACGLCNRRLGPGRDIYMYRGDIAFCSLECRQQQMNHDDRKEKCSMGSINKEASSSVVAASASSANGESIAAA